MKRLVGVEVRKGAEFAYPHRGMRRPEPNFGQSAAAHLLKGIQRGNGPDLGAYQAFRYPAQRF